MAKSVTRAWLTHRLNLLNDLDDDDDQDDQDYDQDDEDDQDDNQDDDHGAGRLPSCQLPSSPAPLPPLILFFRYFTLLSFPDRVLEFLFSSANIKFAKKAALSYLLPKYFYPWPAALLFDSLSSIV